MFQLKCKKEMRLIPFNAIIRIKLNTQLSICWRMARVSHKLKPILYSGII